MGACCFCCLGGVHCFFCYWGEGVYWFAVWAGRRGLGAGACFLVLEQWMCGFAVEGGLQLWKRHILEGAGQVQFWRPGQLWGTSRTSPDPPCLRRGLCSWPGRTSMHFETPMPTLSLKKVHEFWAFRTFVIMSCFQYLKARKHVPSRVLTIGGGEQEAAHHPFLAGCRQFAPVAHMRFHQSAASANCSCTWHRQRRNHPQGKAADSASNNFAS